MVDIAGALFQVECSPEMACMWVVRGETATTTETTSAGACEPRSPSGNNVGENAYIHSGVLRGPEACGFFQLCPAASVLVTWKASLLLVPLQGLQVWQALQMMWARTN